MTFVDRKISSWTAPVRTLLCVLSCRSRRVKGIWKHFFLPLERYGDHRAVKLVLHLKWHQKFDLFQISWNQTGRMEIKRKEKERLDFVESKGKNGMDAIVKLNVLNIFSKKYLFFFDTACCFYIWCCSDIIIILCSSLLVFAEQIILLFPKNGWINSLIIRERVGKVNVIANKSIFEELTPCTQIFEPTPQKISLDDK